MTFSATHPYFLVLIAALSYALATVGMKIIASSTTTPVFAISLICLAFLAAVVSEVVLMRQADLGIIYLTIIAVETLVVLGYAFAIGEGLVLRQYGGAALIFGGLALTLD